MEVKNYKKEANPTYFTAKGTLYKLAHANNEDAMQFLKLIDMSDLEKGFKESGNLFEGASKLVAERMGIGIGCAIELRYNVVSKVLDDSKLNNFFDIACGYTPRSLYCKKKGVDYIGVDVPIVVDEMNEKVGELVKNGKHTPYISADATNPSTIIKASEYLNGEVFISCEGLIMYLSLDELQELISGVKGILAKHGGAWYTSDLGVDYKRVPLPFINDKMIEEKMYNKASTLKDTNDIKYFSNNFKTEEEKIKFFEKNGLLVEKLAIKDMNLNITQLEKESNEVKKNVKALFDTFFCWKLTLKDDEKNKICVNNSNSKVNIEHKLENGKLLLKVDGRIDTLSSPELLRAYDLEAEKSIIKGILIDANKLEYISSAGLRVILKMCKALKSEKVEINGANQVVKEIFKTTGFDKFVNIY